MCRLLDLLSFDERSCRETRVLPRRVFTSSATGNFETGEACEGGRGSGGEAGRVLSYRAIKNDIPSITGPRAVE